MFPIYLTDFIFLILSNTQSTTALNSVVIAGTHSVKPDILLKYKIEPSKWGFSVFNIINIFIFQFNNTISKNVLYRTFCIDIYM